MVNTALRLVPYHRNAFGTMKIHSVNNYEDMKLYLLLQSA